MERISSEGGEPGWLAEFRLRSAEAYAELPIETSPLYGKYTDAARMDPGRVMLRAGGEEDASRVPSFLTRRLGELEGETCIIQIGSGIYRVGSEGAPGLALSSIGDALRDSPDMAREALEAADPREDRFTALNNAAFRSGVFLGIPDGTTLERPVHILTCLPEDGSSVVSRNVIHAGRGSRATVVQELYSPEPAAGPEGEGPQQAYLEMLNATVSDGAHLDVTTLQMMGSASVNFSTRRTAVSRDAGVNWYLGLFGSALSRYRVDYRLSGPGASASDSEVAFGSGGQSFDIQSRLLHDAPHTEGRVTQKSILRDSSRSVFKGMIRIGESATKSNSYLSGRSILLDPGAKSDAIPGLEILTNDVKATHSASVAQIDEEQIFYLQSRCLGRREAERTIVEGFLEPLSRRMSYQVRAWIAYLVESKWEGRELSINTDEELRRFVEVEETRYNEDAEIEQHYKYR